MFIWVDDICGAESGIIWTIQGILILVENGRMFVHLQHWAVIILLNKNWASSDWTCWLSIHLGFYRTGYTETCVVGVWPRYILRVAGYFRTENKTLLPILASCTRFQRTHIINVFMLTFIPLIFVARGIDWSNAWRRCGGFKGRNYYVHNWPRWSSRPLHGLLLSK